MPKRAVDIYWHDHRIGSADFPLQNAFEQRGKLYEVKQVSVPRCADIREVAALPISFDPDFAEIRGITGVELE